MPQHAEAAAFPPLLELSSSEMAPAIRAGTTLGLSVSAYRTTAPGVGDIVLYAPPRDSGCSTQHAKSSVCPTAGKRESSYEDVGRIVAVPGDTVAIRQGHVIRNGRETNPRVVSPCARGDYQDCNLPTPRRIPAGEYFVLHDNRAALNDSRQFGPVPGRWIIGKLARLQPIPGSDIVVAIVGGVLLLLVLSRPALTWPKRLADSAVRSLEAALTALAFVIGGFVFAVLFRVVEYEAIAAPAGHVLICAAVIIAVYGLLINHVPFVTEDGATWQAVCCYLFFALGGVLLGIASAGAALDGVSSENVGLVVPGLVLIASPGAGGRSLDGRRALVAVGVAAVLSDALIDGLADFGFIVFALIVSLVCGGVLRSGPERRPSAMRRMTLAILSDDAGRARWCLSAANGRILALSAASFTTPANAAAAARDFKSWAGSWSYEIYSEPAGGHRWRAKDQDGQPVGLSAEAFIDTTVAQEAVEIVRGNAELAAGP